MKKIFILFVLIVVSSIVSAQEFSTCPGWMPSRLMAGQQGRVTPGDANNVRSAPSAQAELVGQIPGSAAFTVLEGPELRTIFLGTPRQ